MAGQSNMQGWQGDAQYYPADPAGMDKQIRFYWVTPGHSSSEGKWTRLQAQGGRFPKGHFGPEITFARALKGAGFNPAIFKCSLGSTGLSRDWRAPGEGGLYDKMIVEFRSAIAQLEKEGCAVKVRAFVWVQGESDAETDDLAADYQRRLRLLIVDVRENVARNSALPIILGVDEQHPWVKNRPVIVESQKRLAQAGAATIFTSMLGLPKADESHLTPAGLEAHGKRLFEAFVQLTKKAQPGQ